FEPPYFSCVPYLLGEGQAMQYSVWPKSKRRTSIPRLPFRPPDDYLRDAMVAALAEGDVELDVRLQRQTDPHLMPVENNAVLWPERLSPRVSVATRSEEHTSELQSHRDLVCRLLLERKPTRKRPPGHQNRLLHQRRDASRAG